MAFERALAVADAVLFEGYVLYPYRASAIKNQVRWQFGVLAPQGADPSETSFAQTECLVEPGEDAALRLRLRFLQVQRREDGSRWEEGVVQEIDARAPLRAGMDEEFPFEVPGGVTEAGRRRRLNGVLRVSAERIPGPYGLLRLRVRVENRAVQAATKDRSELLQASLVAAHTLIGVSGGVFLSLADPPEWARGAAQRCENLHTWPVLIDETTVLSSPIILDDRPEIAEESTASFYDGTEIDELLVLRTMTLTDEEKREARATDERAAAVIDHADSIPPEVFERLHGAIRSLRPTEGGAPMEPSVPWWDPGADTSVSPETDSVEIVGGLAARGSKVRIRPGRRHTDAQDLFLHGRTATVEAVLFDVDGQAHVAVTLDDDPAAELNASVGRFLYFAPDEVEVA